MGYEPQIFKGAADARADDKGPRYLFCDKVLIAVDAALAAERPLLVGGPPGCGKSSLARAIATGLRSRYLAKTVTSRTRIEDLFAEVDTLERLADAQIAKGRGDLGPAWAYLRPGVLWWAFDPKGAAVRGASAAERKALGARCPPPIGAKHDPTEGERASPDAVVLLDEIDKADPDLPNDLLEPLDRQTFSLPLPDRPPVKKTGRGRVILVLTTNRERELPAAFLRRCVTLTLDEPRSQAVLDERGEDLASAPALEAIAQAHFRDDSEPFAALLTEVANDVEALRRQAEEAEARPPSAAEYLDAVRALRNAPGLRDPAEIWSEVKSLLLLKPSSPVR